MRFLLASIGSTGDLNPVLGVAHQLRGRGHDVKLAANEVFRSQVTAAGIAFAPLGTAAEHGRALASPEAWHPRKGIAVLARGLVVPAIAPLVELIRAAGADTIVAASTLCLGARVAEELLGNPTATLHFQPAMFRSVIAPPISQGFTSIAKVPPAVRRAYYYGIDRWIVDPLFAPEIERLLGRRVRRILADFVHAPRGTIGLFPPWYASPQVDWAPHQLTDFIRYDGAATALDPDLATWLDAGPPPIAFTAGTAMHHAQELLAAATRACEALGRRGLLLAPRADNLPPTLPAGIRHVTFAPLGALAPRCAALVHHGGIGTAARALEARVAQLVIPMAHDQLDNAARLARLGVARVVERARVTADLTPALDALLGDRAVTTAVASAGDAWRGDGADRTCDLLEGLGRRGRPVA